MTRAGRKRTEQRIARRVRAALRRFYRRIAKELEADPPPQIKRWQDALPGLEAELRKLLEPLLALAARAGVRESKQHVPRAGVDWALVNDRAADWARRYSGELVQRVSQSTHERIREAVARYAVTPGRTLEDLIQETTGRGIDEYRASVIAITETTRAYAEGNQEAWRAAGVTKHSWSTLSDELVCIVCGPLNGKVVQIGAPFTYAKNGEAITAPPAHISCRCNLAPEVDE